MGTSLAELKQMGLYLTKQEQGQERTWLRVDGDGDGNKSSKDARDEIFVGHLPREAKADHIYELFAAIGTIKEIRMMYEFSLQNRGFCFIAFVNETDAKRSTALCGSKLLHHKFAKYAEKDKIHVELSRKQKVLFAGGIEKMASEEQIRDEFDKMLNDEINDMWHRARIVITTIMKKPSWGYCFIEFKNHRDAALAKRLGPREMFGQKITLDWARENQLDFDLKVKLRSNSVDWATPPNLMMSDQMALRRTSLPNLVDMSMEKRHNAMLLREQATLKQTECMQLEFMLLNKRSELKVLHEQLDVIEQNTCERFAKTLMFDE